MSQKTRLEARKWFQPLKGHHEPLDYTHLEEWLATFGNKGWQNSWLKNLGLGPLNTIAKGHDREIWGPLKLIQKHTMRN